MLFRDEKNIDAEKTRLETTFTISDEALQMITSNDFLELVMKNDYEIEDFGRALAHLQFGDNTISKKICQFMLKNIVLGDYNKISGYLDVIEEVVLV